MKIEMVPASLKHLPWLVEAESVNQITPDQTEQKVAQREVLMLIVNDDIAGWLRFGWFWDELPFMNRLHVLESYRGQGFGRRLVERWESDMQARGHKLVLTSSQSDENAQHFYRKLGYQDAGELRLPDEAAELIFLKPL